MGVLKHIYYILICYQLHLLIIIILLLFLADAGLALVDPLHDGLHLTLLFPQLRHQRVEVRLDPGPLTLPPSHFSFSPVCVAVSVATLTEAAAGSRKSTR